MNHIIINIPPRQRLLPLVFPPFVPGPSDFGACRAEITAFLETSRLCGDDRGNVVAEAPETERDAHAETRIGPVSTQD